MTADQLLKGEGPTLCLQLLGLALPKRREGTVCALRSREDDPRGREEARARTSAAIVAKFPLWLVCSASTVGPRATNA